MKQKLRLLVVDDEPVIIEFICDVAEEVGFETVALQHANKFEEFFATGFDAIVLDLVMPERDGIELLRFMAEQGTLVKIILISGYDTGVLNSAQKLAVEHGLNVIATLTKPIIHEQLETLLQSLSVSDTHLFGSHIELPELPDTGEFQQALERGELELWFQPQLDISTGSLLGVEALVRWNHPERGLLMPNVIIPLAEHSNLMDELTDVVIDQSFERLSVWGKNGLYLKMSINVTAGCLKELNFPEQVHNKIEQYQLRPEQITIEVTESGVMQDLTKSLDVLTRLRMKGAELSIDDFGTGYSSMVQLYRVPFSEIKIDQSFVIQATNDAEALAIVEMTIMLGHKLGMAVVAEGVEDQQTWDLLAGLGCDVAQGYFMAKPMPEEQFFEWMKNQYS